MTELAVFPDPEPLIARDIAKRALFAAPPWLALCGALWGPDGLASAAFALALVLANLGVAAVLMARSAKAGTTALIAAALGGYLVRLALLTAAVLAVTGQPWFDAVALGVTIVVWHLGLLFWETRYVSISLANPGLKFGGQR